jgi:hypothetical protein
MAVPVGIRHGREVRDQAALFGEILQKSIDNAGQ